MCTIASLHFAMYDAHFLAQIPEGKIRVHIIHGAMMTYHGDSNRHNNPVNDAHENVGAHDTRQNTLCLINQSIYLKGKYCIATNADRGLSPR